MRRARARVLLVLLLVAGAPAGKKKPKKPKKPPLGPTAATAARPPPKKREPVTVRADCLAGGNASIAVPPAARAPPDVSADPIDVAFYDTRPRVDERSFYRAAALCNSSGRVRFHALLKFPRPIAGFRVHPLTLPGSAQCLYDGMRRLAHGPGPQYLYKPLLHLIVPPDVKRMLLLDTDVVMLRDVSELYAEFAAFGTAVVGVGNEQSLLYQRGSGGKLEGKNGGVQLLDLQGMRDSPQYGAILDRVASGRDGRRIGYLGDQTLYTFLAADYPALFYKLPCEWNRQISMHFGFRNASVHDCPRRCESSRRAVPPQPPAGAPGPRRGLRRARRRAAFLCGTSAASSPPAATPPPDGSSHPRLSPQGLSPQGLSPHPCPHVAGAASSTPTTRRSNVWRR